MITNNVILNNNTQLERYQEVFVSVDQVDIGGKTPFWRVGKGKKNNSKINMSGI